MATQQGKYKVDQTVIGKMDEGMQALMNAAEGASSTNAGHPQMHTAWKAVHDLLHALYMKPNPKPEGSSSVTTSNEGEKKAEATTAENVDTLTTTKSLKDTTTAKAATTPTPETKPPATTPTPETKPETKGGGHCNKKSKRRRRKGRKGRRATKKK